MNLVPIDSITDPRVADYANIRDAELLQRADPLDPRGHRGLFIAEGELVVRRLLESRFTAKSILTTEQQARKLEDLTLVLGDRTPVYLADPAVLNGIVGFNIHRGMLAIGVRDGGPPLAEVLARPGPFLILEDLCNHDNLGGVFRNAAALGGAGVTILLSERCADPLYRKSLRVSMGNVLAVPFTRLSDWPNPTGADAATIRASGVQTWAMTPSPDAIDLAQAAAETAPGTRIALLLGSEGPGLSETAIRSADRRVRIPMHRAQPSVDSLNVAVAAAVGLYELAAHAADSAAGTSDPDRVQ